MTTTQPDWHAHLTLGFAQDGAVTRLVERAHAGPLRVQKPLYPEGAHICHAIVLHPLGGVVGGDQLALNTTVYERAHAVLTTPGAAKWYRANGRVSRQTVTLTIKPGARLEWLPQETILFDASEVELTQSISLGKGASYIGCEILCFGRTASGESFNSGKITQRTSITSEGRLLWSEQGHLCGGSDVMRSPLVLSDKTVCATMLAVGTPLSGALLQAIRQEVDDLLARQGEFGMSQIKSLVVARYLGNSSEVARNVMLCVWKHVRPHLMGCEAVVPRIWNT
jgi:urease accessory protein